MLTKAEFEEIEGQFHDGLGTYAELVLANALLDLHGASQPPFSTVHPEQKMRAAIARLPPGHASRAGLEREMSNILKAARSAAKQLHQEYCGDALLRVDHVAGAYQGACAADLHLHFAGRQPVPISVKTDKSGRAAVADGQTPQIGPKWAESYFRTSSAELDAITRSLGHASDEALRSHYLNVARLVAEVLIRKLGLVDCTPTNFSQAKVTNLDAARYLFKQLLVYKCGTDASRVIILDRATGEVKWQSNLDEVDVDNLTVDQISFRPSIPRAGRAVGSEFGIKVDGKVVVTFQVKHRRGKAKGTTRQYEFQDITTRLPH